MVLVVTLPLLEVYARGILSPLLFLVCSEGLSALLKKAGEQGTLKGVAACTSGPKISHLFFFVDDGLIFCRSTKEECSTLMTILEKYEQPSGQQLNCEKTSLFFS